MGTQGIEGLHALGMVSLPLIRIPPIAAVKGILDISNKFSVTFRIVSRLPHLFGRACFEM
jgi:hypothetical protein